MDLSSKNSSKKSSVKMRTEGDGMECTQSAEIQINNHRTKHRNINVDENDDHKYPHRMPTLINLQPKEIHFVSRKSKSLSKEPKFVPYEPYKAAIRPIVSFDKNLAASKKKPSKNNLDLSVLVSQMAMIDTNPAPFKTNKRPLKIEFDEKLEFVPIGDISKKHWEAELAQLKDEVLSLKTENVTLKDQIKQQAQVNKELKTMLVASMGEDLETTVQTLTEDKQQLASALINSAKHLSTHQEQTEWLAGQCEVWRSKFLASSLMVEELAGWKSVFTKRTEALEVALKQILEERNRVRDAQIHTYRNLQSLHENWLTNLASKELYYTSMSEIGFGGEFTPIGRINLVSSKPKTSNIVDLASVNLKFSENLCNGIEKVDDFTPVLNELPANTDGENLAEKLLATPLEVSRKNDQSSSALVNLAYSKTGMIPNIACCSHCNGQVQLL